MNPNQYGDNPFDNAFAGPSVGAGPQPIRPTPHAAPQNLDDLLNPFAALGLENKGPSKSPAFNSPGGNQRAGQPAGPMPTGAGWTSPAQAGYGSPQAAYAQPQQQQQPQQAWASPQSAFQAPQPAQYGATSPAYGGQQAYGTPSPAYGSYSPAPSSPAYAPHPSTSPAFASGGSPAYAGAAPQPGYASPAYAQQQPQQQLGGDIHFQPSRPGYGNGLTQPSVSDADLSLFAAPVVAAKPSPSGPKPTTPTHQPQEAWAQPVGPKPPTNDGWDNDDFGISWEQPKKGGASAPAPRPQQQPEEEEQAAPRPAPRSPAASSSPASPAPKEVSAGSHATEGNVLARISVRTLIVKEWKETFWIITGGKILLYRSKEDYLYNPVGVQVKKDIPLRDNLRCSEVTCKPYKSYGDLYHFTLEEMLDYGPSLIAKFASTDVKAIRELRAVIIAHIIAERKKRVGHAMRSQQEGHEAHHRPAAPSADGNGAPPARRTPTQSDEEDKYKKWGNIST